MRRWGCVSLGLAFVLLGLVSPVVVSDTVWTLDPSGIERVYDGDTFYVNLPGLPPVFGESLPIRLVNIDTPELRSRCKTLELKDEEKRRGRVARDALTEKLNNASVIRLQSLERGSFFRVVAEVYLDDLSLNQWMVDEGHAVSVFDGSSADWCDIIQMEWTAS